MKIKNILNKLAVTAMGACLFITPSCDYLDVVPEEQVMPEDAMKTYNGALGFLYSAYAFSANTTYGDIPYGAYLAETFCTADDIINPHAWVSDAGTTGSYVLMNTLSTQNCNDFWRHDFNGIGQCLFFLEQLDKSDCVERGIVPAAEAEEWRHEAKALMGYYHFLLLRRYGPIPIMTERVALTTPQSEFKGRYHFDYCVEEIVKMLDEAAAGLPASRSAVYTGRMTSTICKAIKAKLLLLAASPLYNGKFPYPDWKNTNFETPGYGYELVSHTYDRSKWERALQATEEAIQWAESQGERSIYRGDEYVNSEITLDNVYIPGGADDEFKKAVLRMKYLTYSGDGEGNHEAIMTTTSTDITTMWFAGYPRNFMTTSDGIIRSGYSGINPTLNAVKWFLTENGLTIETDPEFPAESEWYKSAGLPDGGHRRNYIINLNTKREPRFYAWIGFDGGDYAQKLADGEPVYLNFLSKEAQGLNASARDCTQTGFLSMKHMPPTMTVTKAWAYANYRSPAKKVIRLAELYLNRAECNAVLGNDDAAIRDVNVIRTRAGAKNLTNSMVASGGISVLEWVKRERAIEFFAESMRYWDLRRWVEADKYIGLGMRQGLNALEKENPSFEEFNKPVSLPFPYTWGPRLYLYPIYSDDIYANPQLVQAPGY